LPEASEAKPMPVPLNALKAKPMPAPEVSCDESPRNIPFHPVSAFSPFQRFTRFTRFTCFTRFTVSNPYILETKRNDRGKADICIGSSAGKAF